MDQFTRNQIEKIDRMAGLAFQNALRLHFDAIRLYKISSYASALALSILSMEEIAKAFTLEDMGWHALVDETDIHEEWKYQVKDFYNHKSKQMRFATRILSPFVGLTVIQKLHESEMGVILEETMNAYKSAVQEAADIPKIDRLKKELEIAEAKFRDAYLKAMPKSSLWRMAASGELEKIKQDALYVGIRGNKSLVAPNTMIQNPLRTSSKKSERFITFVNDYLLGLTVGELGGWYGVDAESIHQQLTRNLVNRLNRFWSKRGKIGKRAIHLYRQKDFGED